MGIKCLAPPADCSAGAESFPLSHAPWRKDPEVLTMPQGQGGAGRELLFDFRSLDKEEDSFPCSGFSS